MNLFIQRTACPVCNFKKTKKLVELDWNDGEIVSLFKKRGYPTNFIKEAAYILMECAQCGLFYQKYYPNEALSNELYNNWIASRKNANISDYSFNPFSVQKTLRNISEINQLINYSSKKPSQLKVLDFGMGWGTWCKTAQLMGLETYGSEINKKQIKYCQNQGLRVIKWDDIPNMNFDIINSHHVLEHVHNPSEIITHLAKGLANKGIIKINVPNAQNIKSVLTNQIKSELFFSNNNNNSLNPVEPLQHLNGFSYRSLNYMMAQNGFKHLKHPFGNYYKHSINVLSIKHFIYFIARGLLPIKYEVNLVFNKS